MTLSTLTFGARLTLAAVSGLGAWPLLMLSTKMQAAIGAPFGMYCFKYICPWYGFWDWCLVGGSFGLLVMAPLVTADDRRIARVLGLTVASIVIYFLAEYIYMNFLQGPVSFGINTKDVSSDNKLWDRVSFGGSLRMGFIGILGALLVAASVKIIAPLEYHWRIWPYVGVAGFVGGVAFVKFLNLEIPLYYVVWHVMVCVALEPSFAGLRETAVTARQKRRKIITSATVLAIAIVFYAGYWVHQGIKSTEAQSKYLTASELIRRGASLWVDPTQNNEHLKTARHLLEEAVELDPDFTAAWAKLVPAYYLLTGFGHTDGSGEMLTRAEARDLATEAMRQIPTNGMDFPEAWVASGVQMSNISYGRPSDLEEAEYAFEKALSLDADNLAALETYAEYRFSWGQYPEAVALYDRAVAIDPLPVIRLRRARAMYRAGRVDEAREEYFAVARLHADAPYEGGIAEIEFDRGHFHHGLLWLNGLDGSLQPPFAWHSLGDNERMLKTISIYRPLGGTIAAFLEQADFLFERNYQGLIDAYASSTDANKDVRLLQSLYFTGKWEEAVSMVENWPRHPYWPRYPEFITGAGDAFDWRYRPSYPGYFATHATYFAHALASVGRREEAEAVWRWALDLVELLPKDTPRRTQERHHLRLLVFSSRGETEAALSEFEAMVDAGWRWLMSPGSLEYTVYSVGFAWFEDSPLLNNVRDEPRFITLLEQVKADNAAMLAELNAGLTVEVILDEHTD